MFRDPFRGGKNILVLCECYDNDGTPNRANYRAACKKSMDAAKEHEPWFGLEQEYTLFDADGQVFGWPKMGFPGPQGPYYCGVGTGKVFARDFIEAHYVSSTVKRRVGTTCRQTRSVDLECRPEWILQLLHITPL
jgi:glutamine synthetase